MAADEAVSRVLRDLSDCRDYHDRFVERLVKAENAYRAILEIRSDAAQWTSKLHPPWLKHIIETTIAALVDDKMSYKIKPRARLYDPGEYEKAKQGARAHEILMANQLMHDRFSEIQRPLALQNAIAGLTVAKTYWKRELVPRKRLVVEQKPVLDPEFGVPIAMLPELVERANVEPVYEGPTTEVVNVRDFFWHEAAVSEAKCRYFIHRIWMSKADLVKLGDKGVFKNTDDVRDPKGKQHDPEPTDYNSRNRVRDMVEVIEHWDQEKRRVTTVGDERVLLREMDYPFWHGSHPFTICSTQPYPFQLDSISQVESLRHLQEALWDLANQRHDNVRLLNNAIFIMRGDVMDPDAYEPEPGARWIVEDPAQVVPWSPNPLPAEISIGAETMLKQDMQNLSSSQPFTSTSEARNIGANTATEAALVSSIGQLAIKQMKGQLNYAYERIGQQRMELNKQFVRKPIYAEVIGLDSQQEMAEILPEMLQGEFLFDISPMNESLMRQERRAESTALMQMAVQSAPAMAAMRTPWNLRAIAELVLDSYDVGDKERFFSAQLQEMPDQGQQQPQQGQPPMGVTGPGSIAPEVSPSNQMSMSPERMLQRNYALAGGLKGGSANGR